MLFFTRFENNNVPWTPPTLLNTRNKILSEKDVMFQHMNEDQHRLLLK
jgi:hypothetical protein